MAGQNINVVTLSGNLTRDPELRSTPSGTSVCKMRVANNRRFKDSSGNWADRPNYFDVTAWAGLADICAQYLSKGRGVLVMGELRWREWTADDNTKRQAVEINAREVQFLSDGKGEGGGARNEAPLEDDPYGSFGTPSSGGDFQPVPESDVPADTTGLPGSPGYGDFAPTPAGALDDDIPFAFPAIPDMEFGPQRRRDLFVGERWLT